VKSGTLSARATAVAAPIALLAILYVTVILPLSEAYEDASGRIYLARETLSRYEAAKSRIPMLSDTIEAEKRAIPSNLFLPTLSAAETQSSLQATVLRLIATSGATPVTSRSLPPIERGSFLTYEIEFDIKISPPNLVRFLQSIETAVPLLRIEIFTVSASEGGQGPVDDDGQPELSMHATIAAVTAVR
jgi:hypothetical protein